MAGLTILRVVDNETLARAEQERIDRELAARQNDPFVLGLVAYLRECWDAARIAKKPIEYIMLRAMRQRNGEYEADKLQQIREQGGSEIYMMITEVKCRAAESWLRDIMRPDQDAVHHDISVTQRVPAVAVTSPLVAALMAEMRWPGLTTTYWTVLAGRKLSALVAVCTPSPILKRQAALATRRS